MDQLRFKTEQQPIEFDITQRRFYNSNSKSIERTQQLMQSNENVQQLVKMWRTHKNSLSITPPLNQTESSQDSFGQFEKELDGNQILDITQQTMQNKLRINDNISPILEKKVDPPLISHFKQQTTKPQTLLLNKQSEKENQIKNIPKSKPIIRNKKSTKDQIITTLQNTQTQILNLYQGNQKNKGQELERKLWGIILQIQNDWK